jgi:2-polyprenyl-3-methyl-5-hydroxy-6-metoxy-1,4-benzoquinol methylase
MDSKLIMDSKLEELKIELTKCLSIIDGLLGDGDARLPPPETPATESPNEQAGKVEQIEQKVDEDTEFESLKKLLDDNSWPNAVDPLLICDTTSEEDKLNRAEGILELLIEEPLKDKKLLDIGCGEGHVAFKAVTSQSARLAVGYDIVESDVWKNHKHEKITLTTTLGDVIKKAPYDVILIYDVLDHAENKSEAEKILAMAKDCLADNGKIYLRTHPWCSRHATHLYHKLNKAFVHLIFTEAELEKMGFKSEKRWIVNLPLFQYGDIIKNANLNIQSSNVLRQRIEPFFRQNAIIAERIINGHPKKNGFPEFQLEQQFLDYVLVK